jgi:hypothetical protein
MNAFAIARFAFAALLFGAGGALVASAAGAAPVPETGDAGMLWLEADPYPADSLEIAPGERILWPVTANLTAPSSGDLSLEVSAADPLATDVEGLRVELAECAVAWELPADPLADGVCPGGGATTIIDETPFAAAAAGQRWELGLIAPGVARYFLATLSLPSAVPGSLATESAEIGFGFRAGDDTLPPALAETGASILGPVLLAGGVLLAGATAASLRGRR